MKNKKLKIALIIVGCIALAIFIGMQMLNKSVAETTSKISITTPNLDEVPDGDYIGEYAVSPVYVKVKVSVKNHEITDVEILQHDNGLGSSAESITDKVIEQQSLDIDAVSGATLSSTCILKAIEDALKGE